MHKITVTSYNQETYELPYEKLVFSGGEVHIKLDPEQTLEYTYRFDIHALITNSEEFMELALVVDAIRRKHTLKPMLVLHLPYIPYARQDRVCAPGEALSLDVFSRLLNSLEFDRVFVDDAHSPVALALINNVRNTGPEVFTKQIPLNGFEVLVAPDAGALKKVGEVAKVLGLEMIRADKSRDVKTGEITGTVVHSEHIGSRDFLIVDDICDGGRTFDELSKVLLPLTRGRVLLYVTHGIFSKGVEALLDNIDHIYTVNLFPQKFPVPAGKLTVLERPPQS